jgi:hypothetical protein
MYSENKRCDPITKRFWRRGESQRTINQSLGMRERVIEEIIADSPENHKFSKTQRCDPNAKRFWLRTTSTSKQLFEIIDDSPESCASENDFKALVSRFWTCWDSSCPRCFASCNQQSNSRWPEKASGGSVNEVNSNAVKKVSTSYCNTGNATSSYDKSVNEVNWRWARCFASCNLQSKSRWPEGFWRMHS